MPTFGEDERRGISIGFFAKLVVNFFCDSASEIAQWQIM